MAKVQAQSKYLDLSESFKLYYVLAIGGFISIFSFALYSSLFIALTMAACTVVVFLSLSRKPNQIEVSSDEVGLTIDDVDILWADCVSWAAVDLPELTEFVLETTAFQQRFIYWYMDPAQSGVQEFLAELSARVQYSEETPRKNLAHNLFRTIGMM